MNVQIVTAPASYPVPLQVAKLHAKIETNDDDAYVSLLIASATEHVEREIGQALVNRTYRLFMDAWPTDKGADDWWDGEREGSISELLALGAKSEITLPYPPLYSVTHIKTYDDADVATTFAAANYFVDTVSQPGRVALRTGATWPVPVRLTNGIEVQWVAGYGADWNSTPEAIRTAILLLFAHWYENREPVISGATAAQVPASIDRIIKMLRRTGL